MRTLLALVLYCGVLALIGYGGWQAWERFVAPIEADAPVQAEAEPQSVEWLDSAEAPALRGTTKSQ